MIHMEILKNLKIIAEFSNSLWHPTSPFWRVGNGGVQTGNDIKKDMVLERIQLSWK